MGWPKLCLLLVRYVHVFYPDNSGNCTMTLKRCFRSHQDTSRGELLHGRACTPGGSSGQRDQGAARDCQVFGKSLHTYTLTLSRSLQQKMIVDQFKYRVIRAEKAEQRESKAQLLANDLKALQAENKNLAKSFHNSNKS